MESLDYILLTYSDIISPENLLKTEQDFDTFINEPSTVEDLESFLKVCEEQELYNWCSKIKLKINEKNK